MFPFDDVIMYWGNHQTQSDSTHKKLIARNFDILMFNLDQAVTIVNYFSCYDAYVTSL